MKQHQRMYEVLMKRKGPLMKRKRTRMERKRKVKVKITRMNW
jgi:hypothetical protein